MSFLVLPNIPNILIFIPMLYFGLNWTTFSVYFKDLVDYGFKNLAHSVWPLLFPNSDLTLSSYVPAHNRWLNIFPISVLRFVSK